LKTMTNSGVRAVLTGTAVMLLVSLGLAAVLAGLIDRGALPESADSVGAMAVSVLAAGIGGFLCGRAAKTAKLPMALASGLAYLLLAFLLRAAVFRTVAENLWTVPICVLAGCVLGGFLSAGKNTHGSNLKNRRKHVEISKKL
jgi:putative membrane protein (TIGR04086 family)